MAQLDIICLSVLGLFALYGFFKGFFTQVMSLLAIVLAYFCASWFAPGIAHFIDGFIQLPSLIASRLSLGLAGLAIFFGVHIFSKLIHKHVINSLSITKYTNRMLGFAVGAAKGMCLIYFLYILISWHPDAQTIYADTQIMALIERSPLKMSIQKPEFLDRKNKALSEAIAKQKKSIEKKVLNHAQSEISNQSLDKLIESLD